MSREASESSGRASPGSVRSGVDARHAIESLALVLTAILAVAMATFIALDWLQTIPGTFGSIAESGLEGYELTGRWLDTLVGADNRVFELQSTIRVVATGVLIGVVAPLVGAFLVHRQMALIGETLAHTAFAGVAIGVALAGLDAEYGLIGLSGSAGELLVSALVVSALAALGLQWLTANTDAYGDVPIAITLAGSFAIGSLVISWGQGAFPIAVDIEAFLFGSTAIVTPGGARLVAAISVVVVAVVVANYKQFLFITFDEQAARVARLNVRGYNSLLVVLTAVVVVGAIQILGVILVAGLLVIPAATAAQVAQEFRETLLLSVIFGQLAILAGLFVAIGAGLPPGGSIILAGIIIYLAAIGATGDTVTLRGSS